VAYIVTRALNDFFDGKWTRPVWKLSKEAEHCLSRRGPDLTKQKAGSWKQQGTWNA